MKKTISIVMLVVVAFMAAACITPEKSIIGTWKSQKTVLGIVTETVYVFNEDGTGTKSSVLDVDFTYTFTEEKLIITTETLGIKTNEEYSFEFKNNKLILTNDNEVISLDRVKE